MSSSTPASFLDETGEITVNQTGDWKRIFAFEGLESDDATELKKGLADQIDDNVLVKFTKDLKDLQFSSERNDVYFGSPALEDSRHNNASVGDELGSGVMLLRPGPTQNGLKLKKEICSAFGVDLKSNTPLKSFLDAVDDSGTLALNLTPPPDWEPSSKTELTNTIATGWPTNATWCITADSGYSVTTTLSYKLDVAKDPADAAIRWVTAQFDGIKPATQSTSSIPLRITLTRQHTYKVDLPDPLSDSDVTRSATLSFAFEIKGFRFNIDVSATKRSLILTPLPGSGNIQTLIQNAFKSDTSSSNGNSGMDSATELLPGGDSNPFEDFFQDVHLWNIKIDDDTTQPSGHRLQWGIGLLAFWKPDGLKGQNVIVALTYDSKKSLFKGRLMFKHDFPTANDLRMPEWDPRLAPLVTAPDYDELDLLALIGLEGAQPPIPTKIKIAEVSFCKPEKEDKPEEEDKPEDEDEPEDEGRPEEGEEEPEEGGKSEEESKVQEDGETAEEGKIEEEGIVREEGKTAEEGKSEEEEKFEDEEKSEDEGSEFKFSANVVRKASNSSGEDDKDNDDAAPTGFSWDEALVDVSVLTDKDKKKSYKVNLSSTFSLTGTVDDKTESAIFTLGMRYESTPPEHGTDEEDTAKDSTTNDRTAKDSAGKDSNENDSADRDSTDKDNTEKDSTPNESTWILQASVKNLSVGLLRSFFDSDAAEGAMAVMSKLTLRSLDILYTYQGKDAASFVMLGVLVLGKLELDLSYQYVSKIAEGATATKKIMDKSKDAAKRLPKDKDKVITQGNKEKQSKFLARLRLSSPSSTIADIAESIVPGAGDSLPEFVGGIVINPPTTSGDAPVAELQFETTTTTDATTNKKDTISVLTFWLNIAGFTFTFVQYHAPSKTKTGDEKPTAGSKPISIVKRVIRISVDQIPMMDKVPLVGQLPQPFDHLEYVWVQDKNSANIDPALKGILRSELPVINKYIPDDIPKLQIQDLQKKKNDMDVVLRAGHHFMVVIKGEVVLDHVFSTDKKSTQPSSTTPASKTGTGKAGGSSATPLKQAEDSIVAPTQGPEAAPTKGNAILSVGPLSVSAITLQYKNGSLFVGINATLKLGPLTFSVIGFTIELELNKVKLDHLADIITKGLIHVSLHGIEVGVKQGALNLEGVFIHEVTAEFEKYTGGIAVGFGAWQVLAVGQYAIMKADGYRSVFVYGKLDGPLIELEFATISGVRLGFGYNYAVRMPGVDELYKFPFISDGASEGAGNDPMLVLNKMLGNDRPFVYPKEDSGWFAAGMTITAFDLLTLTAVIMVDINTGSGDNGVVVAMFADGIFQMPPLAPPDASLFYIEIIVGVELNFIEGYIAANAVLAPASHVFVPFAHLTGGASFYSWFPPNSHAGDWVVSVGGFARSYDRPLHYPNPDRIGINFIVGDMIQVIGNGYIAVTPKCAMAGGSLHMSLSVGPVTAYADLVFDAFINFKPFHFRAEISLSVGVECDIDILFIHIHVSIHLGADLVLWGPHDFGGTAWVDFWFFGFAIEFGAPEDSNAKKPLGLLEFYNMVKEPGPTSAPPENDKIADSDNIAQHKYSIEAGLIPASTPEAKDEDFPSTGATSEWQVLAGTLQIRVDCGFSLSGANLQSADPKDNKKPPVLEPIDLPKTTDQVVPPVLSKPMHHTSTTPMTSILTVTAYQVNDASHPILQYGFKAELVLKSAAAALWGEWDPLHDPLQTSQPDALLNGQSPTQKLVQAVRITSPDPYLFPSTIIEFDATAAMRQTILPLTGLPAPEEQGTLFAGAWFQPKVKDKDRIAQVQRWKDFGNLLSPIAGKDSSATSPVTEIADTRHGLVIKIADVLQWTVRPPDEMKRNLTPINNPPITVTSNGPRTFKDGRTDWELIDAPPAQLAIDLATLYQSLPFILS